jgi:CheY-like chemotaxis protein
MNEGSVLRVLSRETKALIIVSEFEARRVPTAQLRAVLAELVSGPEEKKQVLDLVGNDLKATGYHPDQVSAFLQDLAGEAEAAKEARVTRRLRSPFVAGFEGAQGTESRFGLPPLGATESQTPATPAAAAGAQSASPAGPAAMPGAVQEPKAKAPAPAFRSVTRVSGYAPPSAVPAHAPPPPAAAAPVAPPARPVGPGPSSTLGGTRVSATRVIGSRDTFYFGAPTQGVQADKVRRPKVLLADDDKRIRIVFRLGLERLGCQVIEAADGHEAWRFLEEGSIDLAVLDMKMPGLHGLEVLARMVDKHVTPPVVVCSAYDNLRDEFVVASYPKLRYLVKPVSSEALVSAVRELLGLPVRG